MISESAGIVKSFLDEADSAILLIMAGMKKIHTGFHTFSRFIKLLISDMVNCGEEAERLCGLLEMDRTKRIRDLSLGNRKKVSIVCAMQHCPELLILDEPTSGLDPLMQEVFFRLLLESNVRGTTIFLSSHVLSEVKRYCRNAAIIRQGTIVRTDTVENLSKTNLRLVKLKEGGQEQEFRYTGSMKELIGQLADREIEDLLIQEPTLDELFMHYYEDGEG